MSVITFHYSCVEKQQELLRHVLPAIFDGVINHITGGNYEKEYYVCFLIDFQLVVRWVVRNLLIGKIDQFSGLSFVAICVARSAKMVIISPKKTNGDIATFQVGYPHSFAPKSLYLISVIDELLFCSVTKRQVYSELVVRSLSYYQSIGSFSSGFSRLLSAKPCSTIASISSTSGATQPFLVFVIVMILSCYYKQLSRVFYILKFNFIFISF